MLLRHALLLGLASGLLAVGFRQALDVGQDWLAFATQAGRDHGLAGWLVLVLAAGMLALLSRWLVRAWAPQASGSGIPHAKAAIEGWRVIDYGRIVPVKFVAGWLALTGGLALGREGPTVQMGAALGEALRHRLGLEDRRVLAIGAGAGLTAAFNAPLAGTMFCFEELRGVATPQDMFLALVACTSADWVCRSLTDQQALMLLPDLSPPPLRLMPAFILVALAAAGMGVLFNRGLLWSVDYFTRVFSGRSWGLRFFLVVGLVVGTLGWLEPTWVGSGERLAQAGLLMGNFDPLLTLTRYGLTLFSYALGTPGGIFAPLLVLGSQMGTLVGGLTGLTQQHPSLVVVGMAAMVTAAVQAPVTAVLLLLELSGRYSMIFPLTVACGVSYWVARCWGGQPIFDQLMERDRRRYQQEQAAAAGDHTESPDSSRGLSPSESQ